MEKPIKFQRRSIAGLKEMLDGTLDELDDAKNVLVVAQYRDDQGNWNSVVTYSTDDHPMLVYALNKALAGALNLEL